MFSRLGRDKITRIYCNYIDKFVHSTILLVSRRPTSHPLILGANQVWCFCGNISGFSFSIFQGNYRSNHYYNFHIKRGEKSNATLIQSSERYSSSSTTRSQKQSATTSGNREGSTMPYESNSDLPERVRNRSICVYVT